jgi:uncharacterized membrane protein
MALFLAFGIGLAAGLRSFTPLAAVGWAVRLGWLPLRGSPLAILGSSVASYGFAALALAELVADKLPRMPSRKTPGPFAFRIVSGAISGAAVGAAAGSPFGGLVAGAAGGLAGTLCGYEFRARLVKANGGKDFPVALLEDAIALLVAFVVVRAA